MVRIQLLRMSEFGRIVEVEIHALEREKDSASKERLQLARKAISELEEKLQPLKAAYENEKKRGEEINYVRKKIDELKAKADEAERRCDSLVKLITGDRTYMILDTTSKRHLTSGTMPCRKCNTNSRHSKHRKLRKTPLEARTRAR